VRANRGRPRPPVRCVRLRCRPPCRDSALRRDCARQEEEDEAFTAGPDAVQFPAPAGEQPHEGREASGAAPGAVAGGNIVASILKTALVVSSPASSPRDLALQLPVGRETFVGSMLIYDGDIAAERNGRPESLNSSCVRETGDGNKGQVSLCPAQGKQHEGARPHSDQNEEDFSSDSDHFDLSHLESPREAELSSPSHEGDSQEMEQDGAAQVERGPESVAKLELEQWETDVPIPPPRNRSRSRTPPSDNDDHFHIRREKHKAKKRLKESMQEQQAVLQKAYEVAQEFGTGLNEREAASRQSEWKECVNVTSANLVSRAEPSSLESQTPPPPYPLVSHPSLRALQACLLSDCCCNSLRTKVCSQQDPCKCTCAFTFTSACFCGRTSTSCPECREQMIRQLSNQTSLIPAVIA